MVNTDASWPSLFEAQLRVLNIQTKLHQWAVDNDDRRSDDLFNLVTDPAFLMVAWDRVRGNRGARSAGVDGVKPRSIVFGEVAFLARLRSDFLGFRIQRQTQRGSKKRYVYTWPAKKSLTAITGKVKEITKQGTNQPLSELLRQLNQVLRGWTNYFRHGVSHVTFRYVHQFTWLRVVGWLRRKHRRANWKWLRRRYLANGWWPEHDGMALFDCRAVAITRYRYRGSKIPKPWSTTINAA